MGCIFSKKREEEKVVGICRERKRLIKLAVEKRFALSDAHCKYSKSLYAVSAAIRLFVTRHSTPSSPFLITFEPDTENSIKNPVFLQQKPSEPKTIGLCGSTSPSTSKEYDEEELPYSGSDERDSGWDFFNPFFGGFQWNSDEDLEMIREEEGIPELEEEECCEVVRPMNGGDEGPAEEGLTAVDAPGRELLDALRDIEDHFIRAYDSGKEVCSFLEANKVQLTSGVEQIRDNSMKLVQAITWRRSSSCKSLAASTFEDSSLGTEHKDGIFSGYGGMVSGSHSLTLERLYAWEKKLYDEVKKGDNVRRIYEKRSLQPRKKDVRDDDDKSRAARKDLYSEMLVLTRRAESISEKIKKVIVEELQPQIIELLHGLAESWKIILECHEIQNTIIFEVRSYNCPAYGKFCGDIHRLATRQLEAEIQNWEESLLDYIAAQKSYVETLHGWLSSFMAPEVRLCGPLLFTICRDWLYGMKNLPYREVSVAMKRFENDVRALWVQQREEQVQKRKVEGLAEELDKKIRYSGAKKEDDVEQKDGELRKRDSMGSLRRRLEMEKERHHKCMQETQRVTLNGFQTGLGLIFESLVRFAKDSSKMYDDLVFSSQNLGMNTDGRKGHRVCLETTHFAFLICIL